MHNPTKKSLDFQYLCFDISSIYNAANFSNTYLTYSK